MVRSLRLKLNTGGGYSSLIMGVINMRGEGRVKRPEIKTACQVI